MIQMDFVDHYSNVTFDTVMSLKFALTQIHDEGLKNLKFVMIMDDDSFVNVWQLQKALLGDSPIIKEVRSKKGWSNFNHSFNFNA